MTSQDDLREALEVAVWGASSDTQNIVAAVLAVLDQQGWVSVAERDALRALAEADNHHNAESHLLNALDILTGFVGNEEYRFNIPAAVNEIEAARIALREAARYEPSGWMCEVCESVMQTSGIHVNDQGEWCGQADLVPLYRQVTEGEEG